MERIGVAPGTEIGGYRVVAPLGHGGMGAVYRARDGEGTEVALKLLHPHLGGDPDARERLRREVANLHRIRHPGVARVLDAEIDSTEAFLVTELIEGPDLAALVAREGPLPAERLAEVAESLYAALATVHGTGVLHRDVTPANVLVTDRGPVLIDFGIAQAADDARVTSTGLVIGTPGYLSPELLEGGEPSVAGDWWGWAALLAFAATGRPPFGTRPLMAVLARVRAGEADLAGLDGRTAAVLRSALQVDPWRRAAPEEVVSELRRAAADPSDEERTGALGTAPTAALAAGVGGATAILSSDGRTRALTAAAPGGPASQDQDPDDELLSDRDDLQDDEDFDDEYQDDEYQDDEYLDDEHLDDEQGLDGRPDDADEALREDAPPRPEPRRRAGTVAAVGVLLAAVGSSRPGVALAVAAVLAVLVRTVGVAVAAMHARQDKRGAGRADTPRAVALSPWYLVRAAAGVVPAVLVAACVVLILGGVGWWLLSGGRLVIAPPAPGQAAGELAGNAAWVVRAFLGGATVVGLLMLWFGPMSRATRTGARRCARVLAPGWAGAVAVVVLALGAAALVVVLLHAEPTVWWPLPGPPELR